MFAFSLHEMITLNCITMIILIISLACLSHDLVVFVALLSSTSLSLRKPPPICISLMYCTTSGPLKHVSSILLIGFDIAPRLI